MPNHDAYWWAGSLCTISADMIATPMKNRKYRLLGGASVDYTRYVPAGGADAISSGVWDRLGQRLGDAAAGVAKGAAPVKTWTAVRLAGTVRRREGHIVLRINDKGEPVVVSIERPKLGKAAQDRIAALALKAGKAKAHQTEEGQVVGPVAPVAVAAKLP